MSFNFSARKASVKRSVRASPPPLPMLLMTELRWSLANDEGEQGFGGLH